MGMMTTDEQETRDALLKAGFDSDDISAIMGNISVETGDSFDHTQLQKGGGGGYGLFQFTGSHKDDYFDWIKANKIPDSKFSQAKFVYDNIYAKGGYGRELGWKDRGLLQSAFDDPIPTPMALSPGGRERVPVSQKTKIFADVYEKAGIPHMRRRLKKHTNLKGCYRCGRLICCCISTVKSPLIANNLIIADLDIPSLSALASIKAKSLSSTLILI